MLVRRIEFAPIWDDCHLFKKVCRDEMAGNKKLGNAVVGHLARHHRLVAVRAYQLCEHGFDLGRAGGGCR